MQLKYITQENLDVIFQLEKIIENSDYDKMYLNKYFDTYRRSKINFAKLCLKCAEWQELNLPFDCLLNPDYCVKNAADFKIIKLYEDLKMYIEEE